jgi:hypothetical protein
VTVCSTTSGSSEELSLLEDEELTELELAVSRIASASVPNDVDKIDATRIAVTEAAKVPMINRNPSWLNFAMMFASYSKYFFLNCTK